MASTVGFSGRNLPPPQSPFVDKSNLNLSYDGYQFLLDLLNTATTSLSSKTVNGAVVAKGATQATATQLANDWNVITSGGGSGVLLAVSTTGQSQTIINQSGGNVTIYPPPGYQIDALGANVGYTLANTKTQIFNFISSSQIYSLQLG